MLLRCFFFLFLQLVGAALGWWYANVRGAVAGACAAAWLWFMWDMWRALRVLEWLRQGDLFLAPVMRGLWGEVVDRARRLLRQGEQQAAISEVRLEEFLAALQASPNGVILLDAQGRIEWFNQTAGEHLGLDAERDMMQSIGNLLRDPAFNTYYSGDEYGHGVVLPGRQSTQEHPIQLSLHLYPYGNGQHLMLSRDVTALEQAEAMRRDFVANVSHEIRTPLTVMMGFIETLQTLELSDDERERYLALMAQQAARMHNVVRDLLALSRLEGSPLPGMVDWVSVRPLLQRCEEEARALSQLLTPENKLPHALQFPLPTQLPLSTAIAGNQAELYSALSNLVSNAVRYTPSGGEIVVQWLWQPDGSARLSVRDSGPGIAPEHLPRLTERFYRVDRSRSRETGGTGLGLAIAKHALQRHGAQLEIASVLGRGSEFSIVFPSTRLRH